MYEIKVDSIIRDIINANSFPDEKLTYYATTSDSIGFYNELAPLKKRIFYPDKNITIEYRDCYSAFKEYEIIICYDDKNYFGIPFYWQKINDSLKLDLFELKLNTALQLLYSNYEPQSKEKYLYYSKDMVNYILSNISLYNIAPMHHLNKVAQIELMKNLLNSKPPALDSICSSKIMENLLAIASDTNENSEYYYFNSNYAQLKFEFTNENFKLTEINSFCFKNYNY